MNRRLCSTIVCGFALHIRQALCAERTAKQSMNENSYSANRIKQRYPLRLKWGIQMHTFAGLNRSNEEKLFDVTISVDAGWECHYNLPTPVTLKINQYAISTSGLLSPR